jgi:hypothetical protein
MNRAVLAIVMWTLLTLLVAGCSGETSGQDSEGAPDSPGRDSEKTIQVPLDEPTVRDASPRTPEELSEAQRELDAQCAQMDVQEAQEMGMPPEEFGCEADGTGVPVREWLDRGEQ